MAALYEAGFTGKLYRFWFELNKKTEIKVMTGVGVSGTASVGETVAQGSIGGALASSLNLDVEENNFFSGSIDEVSYSNVRLQHIILKVMTSAGFAHLQAAPEMECVGRKIL